MKAGPPANLPSLVASDLKLYDLTKTTRSTAAFSCDDPIVPPDREKINENAHKLRNEAKRNALKTRMLLN